MPLWPVSGPRWPVPSSVDRRFLVHSALCSCRPGLSCVFSESGLLLVGDGSGEARHGTGDAHCFGTSSSPELFSGQSCKYVFFRIVSKYGGFQFKLSIFFLKSFCIQSSRRDPQSCQCLALEPRGLLDTIRHSVRPGRPYAQRGPCLMGSTSPGRP